MDEACATLGLEFERDKKTYAWWGSYVSDSRDYGEHRPEEMGKCAHAIKVAGTAPRNGSGGPWEIGVVPAKDGDGFGLYFDTYGGAGAQLTAKVGHQANALRREYACAVATRKAQATLGRKGWTTTRVDLPNGRIQLKLRKR